MSTIDELLDEQLEVEENPICVIDKLTRKISMHEECKFFGVQCDKRVERIKFECPEFVGDENVDLAKCSLFIAYENANGEPGLYTITDLSVVGENVNFSWLFDEDVTLFKGEVKFVFYATKLNTETNETENAWSTIPATGFVEEGLNVGAEIENRYPSIIESVINGSTEAVKLAGESKRIASNALVVANEANKTSGEAKQIANQADQKVEKLREVVSKFHSNIVEEASGDVIFLDGSSDMELAGLKMFGRTTQFTTTGKNLFGGDIIYGYFTGSTWTKNSDNTTVYIPCNPSTYYTVSKIVTSRFVVGSAEELPVNTGDTILNYKSNYSASSITIKTGETAKYLLAWVRNANTDTSTTWQDVVNSLQIEYGEVATEYEPYTGGIPSPNPEYPQPLESVGDDGSVGVTVAGKNLFGGDALADKVVEVFRGVKDTTAKTIKYLASNSNAEIAIFNQFKPNTRYTIIWTSNENSTGATANLKVEYTDGTSETLRYAESAGVKRQIVFVTSATKTANKLRSVNNSGTAYLLYEESGIFEGVLTADDFEAYTAQTLTVRKPVDLPVFLPGIPVTSGGNYTDEIGQQWFCDEADFASGKYVQRVGKIDSYVSEDISSAYISTTGELSAGATVLYALPDPIEHDLTAEELAQYAALHTNYPNTTIFNDGGADMGVQYVADTKMYIDKKFAELSTALLNN